MRPEVKGSENKPGQTQELRYLVCQESLNGLYYDHVSV